MSGWDGSPRRVVDPRVRERLDDLSAFQSTLRLQGQGGLWPVIRGAVLHFGLEEFLRLTLHEVGSAGRIKAGELPSVRATVKRSLVFEGQRLRNGIPPGKGDGSLGYVYLAEGDWEFKVGASKWPEGRLRSLAENRGGAWTLRRKLEAGHLYYELEAELLTYLLLEVGLGPTVGRETFDPHKLIVDWFDAKGAEKVSEPSVLLDDDGFLIRGGA